jgi:menaquinone-dependent protoporphyrinogen IX oxidase
MSKMVKPEEAPSTEGTLGVNIIETSHEILDGQKILLSYYSRTGNTRIIAETISKKLRCDLEEITEPKNRSGLMGYMSAGSDAQKMVITSINPTQRNVEDYDLVIVGTPIWAWNMSAPIRSYLTANKGKFRQLAFYLTLDGRPGETLRNMENVVGKAPLASELFYSSEIKKKSYEDKVERFSKQITLATPSSFEVIEGLTFVPPTG